MDIQDAFYRLAPHLVDTTVDADGVITYADRRFVFFHTPMFARLFERMQDVAGPVIQSRIQRFGRQAGHTIAAKMDADFRDSGFRDILRLLVASGFAIRPLLAVRPTDDRAMMEKIFGYGRSVGWIGLVDIAAYEAGDRAVFNVENSFEAASYGETGEHECRFILGVLAGIVAYYWGIEDLTVEETACECAGDRHCRIVLEA